MVKQINRIKNCRGEGYVDVAVTIIIVAFVLVFTVNTVSLVALNQNIKTVSDQLTDYACQYGSTAIDPYVQDLRVKTGIDFACSFDGTVYYDSSTGRVQLGDNIVCTVTYNLTMTGFGEYLHPVTVRASSSGLSQYYWK